MASPPGTGNKPLAGRENHPASWTPVENRASMDETAAAISSRSHLGTGKEAPAERTSTHRSAAGSQGQVELGRDGVFKVPLPPAPTVFSYHGRRQYPPRPTTANYPPPFPRAPFAPYFHDCLASREVGGRLVPIFVSAKWSAGLPLRQSVIDPAQPSVTFPPVSLQRALAQLEQDTAIVRAALLSREQAANAFTQCPPSTQAAGPVPQRAARRGKRADVLAAWKAAMTSPPARRQSRAMRHREVNYVEAGPKAMEGQSQAHGQPQIAAQLTPLAASLESTAGGNVDTQAKSTAQHASSGAGAPPHAPGSMRHRKGNDDVEAGPKAMEGQSHIHGQPQIAAQLAPLTASLESTAISSRSHLGTGEEAPAERTSTHGSAAGSQGQVELGRDGVFKIPLPPAPKIVSHHGRRHYPPRPTTANYPPPFPRAPSALPYYLRMASRVVVEGGPTAMKGQSQAHGQPEIAALRAPLTASLKSTAGGNVDAQAKSTAQHASSGAGAPSRATAPPPPLRAQGQQGTPLGQHSWPMQAQGASSKQPNTPASPQPMATAVDRPAAIDCLTGRLESIKLGRLKWSAGLPLRQSVINPVQPSVTFPPVSLQRALAQLEQDTAPVRAALLLSVASMPPLLSLEQAAKAFTQCLPSTQAAGPMPHRTTRRGKRADVPAAWKARMTSRPARRQGRSSQHCKGNDDVEAGPTAMEGQSQAHGQPQIAAQLAPLAASRESTASGNVDTQAKSTAPHVSSGAGAPSRATAPPPPLHAQQGTLLRQPSWPTQAQGASSNQPPTPASPQPTATAVDTPGAIDSLTGRLGSIKLGRFRPGHDGSTSAVRQPATEPSPASKPMWIFVPSFSPSLSDDAPTRTRSGNADDAVEHGTRGFDLKIVLPELSLRDRWLVFLAHSDITALQSVDTAKHEPARLLAFLKWTRQPIVTPYASVHARDLDRHLSGLGDRDRMLIFVALHDPRHVHLIDEFRYPDAETGKWVTLAWHAYFVDYNVPVADQKVWVQSLSRCYPVYYTPTTMAGLTGPIEHIEHICTTPPYSDMPQEELRWTLYKQYACSPILPWALSTLPGEHVDKQLKCGRGIRGLFDRMAVDIFSKGAALDAAHQSSRVVTKPPSLPRQKQGGQSAASTTKQSADVGPEWTVYVDSLGQSVRIKTLRTAQLREVLGKRGLNTRGNKADLRQRLQRALDEDATMQLPVENRVRQPDANVIMPASLTTTVIAPPIKLTQPAPVPAPAPASLSATPVQALVPKAPAVSTGKGAAATTGASAPAVGPSTLSDATSGEGLQPKTVPMRTHKNDEAQSRVKPEEEHQAIRDAERSKLIRFLANHATEIGTDEREGTAHTLLRVFKSHQVMWNLLLKDYGVPAEQHKDWLE